MWNKLKQWLHPDHITRSSIKEGFDDLPAAVCYFTPDGIIRLCNRQMFRKLLRKKRSLWRRKPRKRKTPQNLRTTSRLKTLRRP